MQTRSIIAIWMGAAFCAAFALAAGILVIFGDGKDGIHASLRGTARLGFVFFWLAYAGGALAALFGPRFQPLKRHGRELGLAFAAVLLVHLGLVAWLCLIDAAPGRSTFIVFGSAAASAYLLVLFSIGSLQRALGRIGWRLLRTIVMNYLLYAFALDFLGHPLHGDLGTMVLYGPFVLLVFIGPSLVLGALLQRAARQWRGYRTESIQS